MSSSSANEIWRWVKLLTLSYFLAFIASYVYVQTFCDGVWHYSLEPEEALWITTVILSIIICPFILYILYLFNNTSSLKSALKVLAKHLFVLSQFICIALLTYFGRVFAIDVVMLLQLAAVVFGVWAVRSVGENNWSVYPTPNEESSISANGAYKIVRHPMYTALILFFLPVALRADGFFSWTIYGVLVFTLILKIIFEERQLEKKHSEYSNFKKATNKRLIPFIW